MGHNGTGTAEQLAEAAAKAMAALGSCPEGTWQHRKALLQEAGERCDSGYDEVVSWFQDEE